MLLAGVRVHKPLGWEWGFKKTKKKDQHPIWPVLYMLYLGTILKSDSVVVL